MSKQGRNKDYKCIYCGKFIAYKDIPKKIGQSYIPDTEHTNEETKMWHKKCNIHD